MTRVQQRCTALLAALVLALGCALVAVTPQAYAAETTLTAGTTFKAATTLAINNKALSASNKTEFATSTSTNYYKFTTTKRESTYRLTLLSYNGEKIYGSLFDASQHPIAMFDTTSKKGQSWTFKNLKRSAVYYISLWRFNADDSAYVKDGTIIDEGSTNATYAPYKITLKEEPVPPAKLTTKVGSNADHKVKVIWSEPSYAAEKVQVQIVRGWKGTGQKTWTFTAKASARSHTYKLKHFGSTYPYKVRVRAYLTANGKKIYGPWSAVKTVKVLPNVPNGFTATSSKAKTIKVAWDNVVWKGRAKSTDYVQIQLGRLSDGKKFVFTAKAKSGSKTIKVIKDVSDYKVRIRIYQKWSKNETIYGKWTKLKKVKSV